MTEPKALRLAQIDCDLALQKLEKLFQPDCRLTLLMRRPGHPECELLFTKDDLGEVIEAIKRFQERDRRTA